MKRKLQFGLWEKNGKWFCKSRIMPDDILEGDTPQEALASMQKRIEIFNEFRNHFHDACLPEVCSYCKEGKIKRGAGGPYTNQS